MKTPRDEFLDRSKPDGMIRAKLDRMCAMLDRIVNYGTHLMPVLDSSLKANAEGLPVVSLVLHAVGALDAISILLRKGAADESIPPMRTLMEGAFAIEYILREDTERRGIAYQVQHIHSRIDLYKRSDPSTPSGAAFVAEVARDDTMGGVSFKTVDSAPLVARLESMLASPQFKEVEDAWQAQLKVTRYPKWYSLFGGPRSVRGLAAALNRQAWYAVLYEHFSGSIHAADALDVLHPRKGGGMSYQPLRYAVRAPMFGTAAASIGLAIYRMVLAKYASGKIRPLNEWYNREVREDFLDIRATTFVDADRATVAPPPSPAKP